MRAHSLRQQSPRQQPPTPRAQSPRPPSPRPPSPRPPSPRPPSPQQPSPQQPSPRTPTPSSLWTPPAFSGLSTFVLDHDSSDATAPPPTVTASVPPTTPPERLQPTAISEDAGKVRETSASVGGAARARESKQTPAALASAAAAQAAAAAAAQANAMRQDSLAFWRNAQDSDRRASYDRVWEQDRSTAAEAEPTPRTAADIRSIGVWGADPGSRGPAARIPSPRRSPRNASTPRAA